MRKTRLIILTLAILTLIIAAGCGGGSDDIVTPSSLQNTNDNIESSGGYININVIWPQEGLSGKCIMSSGSDDNNLTASMPGGTQYILFELRERDNPSNIFEFEEAPRIDWPNDRTTIGPIPVVWITVRADAYDGNNNLLSTSEEDLEVKVGNNTVGLDLGDYKLAITAEPVIGGSSITALAGGPGPEPTPEPTATPTASPYDTYNINANFSLVYSSASNTPVPQVDKPVKFEIIEGTEYAEFFDGDVPIGTTTTVNTDVNGDCSTLLKLEEEGTVVVEGTYQIDSQTYSDTCVINGEFDYSFNVTVSHEELPLFPSLEKETEIKALLLKQIPNSPDKPVSGQKVSFEIEEIRNEDGTLYSGSDIFLSYPSGITNSEGEAKIYLICNQALGNGRKTVKIKTETEVNSGSTGDTELKIDFNTVYIGDYDVLLESPSIINSPNGTVNVKASLVFRYPGSSPSSPIPVEGALLNFEIGSSSTIPGELSLTENTTIADGSCETILTSTTNKSGTIVVEAEYKEGANTYTGDKPIHFQPTNIQVTANVINTPSGRYFYPGEVIEIEITYWDEFGEGFSLEGLPVYYALKEGPPDTEIIEPSDLKGYLNASGKTIVKIFIGSPASNIIYWADLKREYNGVLLKHLGHNYGLIEERL